MTGIREKLAAVKTSVKIVDVLRHHGINVPDGINQQISCPFHGIDSHPSARVYTQTNTIFCWTCHSLWDVISAEMQFSEISLNEAVNVLVQRYGIDVQAHPQQIAGFYAHVAKYQSGDMKQLQVTIAELKDKFRQFYQSITDWALIAHIIDYFWQEFDEFDALILEPAQKLLLVTDWYARAHCMVAAQIPSVGVFHPATSNVLSDGADEGDDVADTYSREDD